MISVASGWNSTWLFHGRISGVLLCDRSEALTIGPAHFKPVRSATLNPDAELVNLQPGGSKAPYPDIAPSPDGELMHLQPDGR